MPKNDGFLIAEKPVAVALNGGKGLVSSKVSLSWKLAECPYLRVMVTVQPVSRPFRVFNHTYLIPTSN